MRIVYAAIIIFAFRAGPAWARAIAGSPSTCWASTRRSTACCSRPAPPSASSPLWLLSDIDHAQAGRAGAAVDDDPRLRPVAADAAAGVPAAYESPSGCSASARAASPCSTRRRRRRSAQLSMIPLLTLVAIYAPAGHRATWFALMASLMNLALVAGDAADQVSQPDLSRRPRRLRQSAGARGHRHGDRLRGAAGRHLRCSAAASG